MLELKRIKQIMLLLFMAASLAMVSCNEEDDVTMDDPEEENPSPTDNTKTYDLAAVAVADIAGSATFTELEDGSVSISLQLDNTPDDGVHPAHIHANSAIEGGGIILSLTPVDGSTGMSETIVSALDDGTAIVYNDLLNLDGYINVHLSAEDLGTIVAQGDIGSNELTGETMSYDLGEMAVEGISGTATFHERVSGEALVELMLDNTPEGEMHPAHIHANSAAEGGGIIFSFNPVDGTTGMSKTHMAALDDGTSFVYADLADVDGYINVHLSAEDLGTIVAQADIGQNVLTGESKSYPLSERAVADIEGTVSFHERVNGEVLAEIMLNNTPEDGVHPAHIHVNTAAESGGIAYSFNPVDGNTGMSKSNIGALDDGTAITYTELLNFDGYVNVHLSADALGTIVAQGDIGQNELTGESKTYTLEERAAPGISGSATFYERVNGEALAELMLENTPDGGSHPAHIHFNTAAEGGGIAFSFNPVDGTTGMSRTQVAALDEGTAFLYADVLGYDGYINVHLSADELGTIVAQGDIGQNELTGESISYDLDERAVAGISGTATFHERQNGEALAVIMLENTPDGGEHPAHIHENSASEGGAILFSFNPVDGSTGMSRTQVAMFDDGEALGYSDIADLDGYINVHLSADELQTIVAQGNIGSNAGDNTMRFEVTNSGASSYIFNGNGLSNAEDPEITLTRGETYEFVVNATGHPFLIKTDQSTGTGNTYDSGVTNNGVASGTITFTVPSDAPSTLYYICEFHSSMVGTITISD